MANVLGELFGDIASAIREKTGDEGTMKPAQFPEKISGIETGADVSGVTATAEDVLEGKVFVDADGNPVSGAIVKKTGIHKPLRHGYMYVGSNMGDQSEYIIPEGFYDGSSKVYVDHESKTVTPSKEKINVIGQQYGTDTTGYYNKFLSKVTIEPIPDEYQDVTGVTATAEDVRAGKVFVDAEGNEVEGALTGTIADVSEVTANAEDVLEGKVIVDSTGNKVMGSLAVQSGGGSLPAGAYWEALNIPSYNTYRQRWIEFNGELYALINSTSGNAGMRYIYRFVNNAWSLVCDFGTNMGGCASGITAVEYNGKIHFAGSSNKNHYIFDGNSITQIASFPNAHEKRGLFVQNEKLKLYSYQTGSIYVWDENADTWTVEATPGSAYAYYYFFSINNVLYATKGKYFYICENGEMTQIGSFTVSVNVLINIGNKIYFYGASYSEKPHLLYAFDVNTRIITEVAYLPSMGNVRVVTKYKDKLALMPYDVSYPATLVLHEVTE